MFDRQDSLSQGYLFKVNIKKNNLYFMKYLDQILNSLNPSLSIMTAHLANASFLTFCEGTGTKVIERK